MIDLPSIFIDQFLLILYCIVNGGLRIVPFLSMIIAIEGFVLESSHFLTVFCISFVCFTGLKWYISGYIYKGAGAFI